MHGMRIGRRVQALALALALAFVGFVLVRDGWTQDKKPDAHEFSLPKFLLVTRHCEKDTQGDPRDPGLSELGRKRAAALARLVEPAGVRHVFTSEYKRAQETGAAVAKGHAIDARVLSAADAGALFTALDALPFGETALVVGHSNTVPAILAHFGYRLPPILDAAGKPFDSLPEDDFGSLFLMTIPEKSSGVGPAVIRLHYGD